MKLSVIVPVYDEQVDCVLELLRRVALVPVEKEILVVDDGSQVSPLPAIQKAAIDGLKVLAHAKNQGKGTAIQTALKHATGDVVIIQDADLEYYPEDYVHLLQVYAENQAKAVYGVRDLSGRTHIMRLGNQFVTWVTNVLFGSDLKDMETCYKLIDRELLQALDLKCRRFDIEAEISAKLLRLRIPIVQTAIRYSARTTGKKLSVFDGIPTIVALVKSRFWGPTEACLSGKGLV